jgi:hypothetical protein
MKPAVIAALVTGVFALAVALYNAGSTYWRERKLRELGFGFEAMLEQRKSELSREEAAARARTEYEYNARLSLYQRFEPLLFQLVDLGDFALDRIKNLAEPSVWTKFVVAEGSRPRMGRAPVAKPAYELVSTVYGLFAPLVLVRSMNRQLTLVDLSLEQRIELPYYLASRIYGSFKDDAKLASLAPPLPYDPFNSKWRELREREPATYWWQGLTMGRLENVLDLLSTSGPEPAEVRLLSFGEFERLYERIIKEGDEWQRKALGAATNPLVFFRPESRPVYWRMLIAQACLYEGLLRTLRGDEAFATPSNEDDWMKLLRLENPDDYRWKAEDHSPSLEDTLMAAEGYLRRFVVAPRISTAP